MASGPAGAHAAPVNPRTAPIRLSLALLVGLVVGLTACGSSEDDRPERRDAGRPEKRATKLPADGGLFVDPDRPVADLGREILRDVSRLETHGRLAAEQVTIGAAYAYRFAFAPGELPPEHEALAIPVTVRSPPADQAYERFTLVDERGRAVASEPIVEWLDASGGAVVPPPTLPATDEQRVLLVYFVPKSLRSGALRYGDATLGPVRRGGHGPVRPRSSCRVVGTFSYAPIQREVLLELEVGHAFATWTPMGTSVTSGTDDGVPTVCRGFRRLDARGQLLEVGAPPPAGMAFLPNAKFLAVYDLPEGAEPGTLRWEGTDCEASPIPARQPLPERLGPERGPPRLETAEPSAPDSPPR